MILNMPFPQMLKTMIDCQEQSVPMSQLVEALEIADGARLSPIQMMIGPVTTGGRITHNALYAYQA